jgi:hypothetical protein
MNLLLPYIRWLAAALSVAAVAGLNAFAQAVGIPVADLDPVVQAVLAALIIKGVNFLLGLFRKPA